MERKPALTGPWAVETDLQVHFRDTDAMGHVNNAVYHSWFEHARIEYFRQILGMRTIGDYGVILAQQGMSFRFPVELASKPRVGIRTAKLGRTSIAHEYALWDADAGTPFADGNSVIVWYDYAAKKPAPIPARIRDLILAREPRAGTLS